VEVAHQQETASSYAKNTVVALLRSEFERRGNVGVLKIRVIVQDLRTIRSGRQKVQDVFNPHSQSPYTGAAATLVVVYGNPMKLSHSVRLM